MSETGHEDRGLTTADIVRADRQVEPVAPGKPLAAGSAGQAELTEQVPAPLFSAQEAQELRSRWNTIQTWFVDEPRKSVEQADELVATTVKRVAEIFAEERSKLEGQWDRGDRISTEDLRLGLQRYRSFFARLLSV